MSAKISTKKLIVLITFFLFLTVACALTDGSDGDTEALQQQVSALETQNALLQDQSSSENEVQAPQTSENNEVQVPAPPTVEPAPQVNQVEPTVEALPSEPVEAGKPVIYDGWALTVSKEIETGDNMRIGEFIQVKVFLRNLGDTDRVFRYTNSSVTMQDNLGNVYDSCLEEECCQEMYHNVKNYNVPANESVDFIPMFYYDWCDCEKDSVLPPFEGPIALDASQLIVHFEKFGPFSGVDVVIDL
ncbi:MAG: hypothetical protein JEZ06_20630 [Anaerolineaceae bacterium]|nr:hypothetical protein [Anaerolineaceae bacterium]